MNARAVCSLCGRRGGHPANGAAINSMGCTGACLRWAVQVIKNPPFFEHHGKWEAWFVRPADVASFGAICSDINGLGYGYLHWDLVIPHKGSEDMWAAGWIALAHERYSNFVKSALPGDVAALCPDVPAFYQTLDALHQNCVRIPTVLYTVHFEPIGDDACHVQVTTMSGQPVSDVVVPRSVPLNAWQHVPPPLYRIAKDRNLYTLQEYQDYYGKKASSELWTRAPPCYEHVMDLVTADGEFAKLSPWTSCRCK